MKAQSFDMMKFEMPKFEMPKLDMLPLQGVDAEALMAAHRRNIEAMQSAGQILADGARTFTQRQAEIMQARMTEFQARAESMLKADPKGPAIDKHIDEAKSAYEQALADSRELMEIVTKAQTDAMHVFNQCAIANFEEMKKFTS